VENGGQSWYNALALQFQSVLHGITGKPLHVEPRWTMPTCRAQATTISSTFNNALANGNYKLDKGSSTLDHANRASINWVWRPVFTKNTSASRILRQRLERLERHELASSHPVSPTMKGLEPAPTPSSRASRWLTAR